MTTTFDKAVQLAPAGDHRYTGATEPTYTNMVGPFGGTTAATLLNAVLLHPLRQGDPISLTVNFAGPVADGAFEIEAHPVRTNRSTQHWSLQLLQQGQVAVTATAVLAQRRRTWSAAEATMPDQGLPPASDLQPLSLPGAPAWVGQYEMRFGDGEAPTVFDGREQPHAHSRMWIRDAQPRALDFLSLAALCDSFFPRIFIRRRAPTPIGTVSLTCFFHADAAQLAQHGERHVLGSARALAYRNGYFDQSAEIWGDDGQLLASSHQMVYFRE
ncbi:MAG: thioesterase family protein [Aquabacterium sp.]|nr:MAG: thioesterase family protein [Aquabacterium sp.]